MDKPWLQLSPNDYSTEWWRYSYIIDEDSARIFKDEQEILCHFIIQDCNMAGSFWRISTWYNNDPNRYMQLLFETQWNFSKPLTEMKENDIVCLNTKPNIKFKVKLCRFVTEADQIEFCKILERVDSLDLVQL